ncbi:MAG: phosphoribosylglycinamide formyltransferase [Casimicrobiaceae bacterium]
MPTRISVLISGRGSNLAALIDAERAGNLGGTIVRVISNRPGAAGLAHAFEAGIPTTVVDHRAFSSRAVSPSANSTREAPLSGEAPLSASSARESFDAALRDAIDAGRPDLVVLAGFMRVLGASFVRHYQGRLLNVHPSLLPAFPGLDTHRRALAAGASRHGCTVHFVTAEVDGGPIVAQAEVPVLPGDDAERLAARVLEQEHRLLPQVVRWFCGGRLALVDGRILVDGVPVAATSAASLIDVSRAAT